MTVRSANEIITTFKRALQQVGSKLTSFSPYSNIGILYRSIASVISEHEVELDSIKEGFFFSTAVRDDLDRRAADFDLYRKEGQPSIGKVLLRSSSLVNSEAVEVPVHTILTTAGGEIQIETLETVYSISGDSLVNVQSLTLSLEANLTAGTSLYSNLYPTVSFTVGTFRNLLSGSIEGDLQGGRSTESDGLFRNRVKTYISNLPRATYDALTNAILAIPSVGKVFIKEHTPVTGYLTIYVDSDNLTILRRVAIVANDFKAAGVAFVVKTLQQTKQRIALEIELERFTNSDAIVNQVKSNIYRLTDGLNIGGILTPEAIAGSVLNIKGILNVRVFNPTGPVSTGSEESILITNINISVVLTGR